MISLNEIFSVQDYEANRQHFAGGRLVASNSDSAERRTAVFYIIRLEPESDPGRFKVGFSTDVAERLRSHQTSAPFSVVVKTWPCKALWEKTAIDCIADGCERLAPEVFRTVDLEDVIHRADRFFKMMPALRSGQA